MQRRRVMLSAGKRSRLPREYQEVEWIAQYERTRGYVETDIIIGANDYSVYAEFVPEKAGTYTDYFFHGTASENYLNAAPYKAVNGMLYFFPDSIGFGSTIALNEKHILQYSVKASDKTVTGELDGNQFSVYIPNYTVGNAPFLLFSKNYGGNWHFGGKYLSHQMTVGNNPYNLIACVRKSDLKPGFFEFVNEKFYPATGNFTVGPNVN